MKFWLSFCDGKKEKGKQFIGVILIEAEDFISAIKKTHKLKINPGGEVQGFELEKIPHFEELKNRLVDKKELEIYFDDLITTEELENETLPN